MQHIVIAPGDASHALQAFIVPDTRAAIELAVEAFLQRLDEMDGDPDVEPNGDELDGNSSEDDFMDHAADGPGCPITDFDCCLAGDDGCGGFYRNGEIHFGSADEEDSPVIPRYGVDQSRGPINETEAWRAHKLAMLAL